MGLRAGTEPCRWWIEDGWCEPPSLALPPPESDLWEARYSNDCERGKRTTRRVEGPVLAPLFARLRAAAAKWSARLGYAVEDDPTLHGGGLHVTEPGGVLAVHLDYDRHPLIAGRRRALNLIAFLHPRWDPEWGGALILCDSAGRVVQRIEPVPGRLAAFEVGDLSYHGVERVTGPAERVTAAVYYLSEAGPSNTRERALFMPAREDAMNCKSCGKPARTTVGPWRLTPVCDDCLSKGAVVDTDACEDSPGIRLVVRFPDDKAAGASPVYAGSFISQSGQRDSRP